MKTAKLKVLGIEAPIGLFDEYHDDGFVKSVEEYRKKLFIAYNQKYNERFPEKGKIIHGNCSCMSSKSSKRIHIYYANQIANSLNILTRAHEETHALEWFGGLDLLSEKILEEEKTKINFKEIDDEEVRAEIGSIYALFKHRFGPYLVNNYNFSPNDNFNVARDIYLQSKLPSRSIFTPQ